MNGFKTFFTGSKVNILKTGVSIVTTGITAGALIHLDNYFKPRPHCLIINDTRNKLSENSPKLDIVLSNTGNFPLYIESATWLYNEEPIDCVTDVIPKSNDSWQIANEVVSNEKHPLTNDQSGFPKQLERGNSAILLSVRSSNEKQLYDIRSEIRSWLHEDFGVYNDIKLKIVCRYSNRFPGNLLWKDQYYSIFP